MIYLSNCLLCCAAKLPKYVFGLIQSWAFNRKDWEGLMRVACSVSWHIVRVLRGWFLHFKRIQCLDADKEGGLQLLQRDNSFGYNLHTKGGERCNSLLIAFLFELILKHHCWRFVTYTAEKYIFSIVVGIRIRSILIHPKRETAKIVLDNKSKTDTGKAAKKLLIPSSEFRYQHWLKTLCVSLKVH